MQLLEPLPTPGLCELPALIDGLLAEQQALTAVERFARLHEAGAIDQPAHAKYYRDLIPLAAPQPGEQYAFTVDLDSCSGCKACVTACHSLNGLDDGETFRDVGALTGRDHRGLHVLQHVSTACHHCLEPACLSGCPTQAYDKDPATGIVRHLDDQCMGCQYCTLMCPYDVPKYNAAKGIVRKCDMCHQRLVDGEAPACVQACPNQAIRIELVEIDTVRPRSLKNDFLPHAPDPRLTQPTTRFVSSRQRLHDIEPVNDHDQPAHAHLPLVFMLVLTQMAIGMFIAAEALLLAGTQWLAIAFAGAVVGTAGLAAAVLHLGRPQIAYRAWLGWRTSWMSREIIAFHAWIGVAIAFALSGMGILGSFSHGLIQHTLGAATIIAGLIALLCSAMIYVATQREFWSARRTLPRFLCTAALLGPAGALTVVALTRDSIPPTLIGITMAAALLRLLIDISAFQQSGDNECIQRSIDLLTGPLSTWNVLQATASLFGGVVLPLIMLNAPEFASALAMPTTIVLVASEFIQRGLFFAALVSPRMPGVQHS
jgi:Fe-S-cluster-containing dehydrogenase component/DMSO reductase anchor subunit